MKYLIIIITIIFTAGCTPSSLEEAKQDFACREEGGVYEYSSIFSDKTSCRSGKEVMWKSLIVTEKYYPVSK